MDAGLLRATTTTTPLRPWRCEYKTPEHHFSRPLRGILARICGRTADNVRCGACHAANTLVPPHVSSSNHHQGVTMKTESTRGVPAAAIAVRRPRSVTGIAAWDNLRGWDCGHDVRRYGRMARCALRNSRLISTFSAETVGFEVSQGDCLRRRSRASAEISAKPRSGNHIETRSECCSCGHPVGKSHPCPHSQHLTHIARARGHLLLFLCPGTNCGAKGNVLTRCRCHGRALPEREIATQQT